MVAARQQRHPHGRCASPLRLPKRLDHLNAAVGPVLCTRLRQVVRTVRCERNMETMQSMSSSSSRPVSHTLTTNDYISRVNSVDLKNRLGDVEIANIESEERSCRSPSAAKFYARI